MNKTYFPNNSTFDRQIQEFIRNNDESVFNELNFKITEDEVSKAFKHL
jgi:hypothetical protein